MKNFCSNTQKKHRLAVRIQTNKRVSHEEMIAWLDRQLPTLNDIENTDVGVIDPEHPDARVENLIIE